MPANEHYRKAVLENFSNFFLENFSKTAIIMTYDQKIDDRSNSGFK
jgi:hypothetical protein